MTEGVKGIPERCFKKMYIMGLGAENERRDDKVAQISRAAVTTIFIQSPSFRRRWSPLPARLKILNPCVVTQHSDRDVSEMQFGRRVHLYRRAGAAFQIKLFSLRQGGSLEKKHISNGMVQTESRMV